MTIDTPRRLNSIDLMRGLVMVVMALDHVRDFWHHDSLVPREGGLPPINPVDLDEASVWLFLTRWITHFCAPTFVFLAGAGAFLAGTRGRGRFGLASFLVTRGLWLILLDLTLVRLGWSFSLSYRWFSDGRTVWALGGGIIWTIGAVMILLAPLVFLPTSAVAVFGVALVAFHNLFDDMTAADMHLPEGLWALIHDVGGGEVFDGVVLGSAYGLPSCLGMMAAGYGFGALYLLDPAVRRRQMLGLGLMLTALFVGLRFSNLYGDPLAAEPSLAGPWSERETWYLTVCSFFNCQKYPASLLYMLMTLGPAITLLGLFEGASGALARILTIFGRVPLFFYLLHIPLIHGLAVAYENVRRFTTSSDAIPIWSISGDLPANYGVSLSAVYPVWAGVVALLFFPCWWFAGIKERHRWVWLSYL